MSDNDVRLNQFKGFYQKVFKSIKIKMDIKIKFSVPRHPQSNGLCERTNRSFLQNIRALCLETNTLNWPKMVPICTWIMNSQVNLKTGYSPHELFLGKPSWRWEVQPEPETTPWMESFFQEKSFSNKKLKNG